MGHSKSLLISYISTLTVKKTWVLMTVQKDQHNIASVHTTKVIKMIIVSPLQLQVGLNGTNSFSSFWTYVLFRCLEVCGPSRYSTESNSL
jgi:hypothetical protein